MAPLAPTTAPGATKFQTAPIEIAQNTYWVGKRDPGAVFFANPYLRTFRGTDPRTHKNNEFNLLIDPGSSSDFATVSTKTAAVIGSLERLSAVFVNHQDPDVASSLTIVSARFAPKAAIICSEDTWRLIVHMNLPRSRFVATDKLSQGIRLPTGHRLLPVPSPFCHFRGAVMLYDLETRVLFSGDLFGGIVDANARGLFAEESDWSGIRAFHQVYMPANAGLARAVAAIRKLDPPPLMIAPQHGRLIQGALINQFLDRMSRLQVGLDIIDESDDPTTLQAWRSVLNRVLETARALLGSATDAKLADATDIDTISVTGGEVKLERLGKWTVERIVETLTAGEPPEIGGPIQVEAVMAAAEYGLPAPHLDLEGRDADPGVATLGA